MMHLILNKIPNNLVSYQNPFKAYTGEVVKWDDTPHILQAHQLIRDSKLPNFYTVAYLFNLVLTSKLGGIICPITGTNNYTIYLSLDFL